MKLLAALILFVMTSTSIQAQTAADQILGIYWTHGKMVKCKSLKAGNAISESWFGARTAAWMRKIRTPQNVKKNYLEW